MSIAIGAALPDGVVLATDGLWSCSNSESGQDFGYLQLSKMLWFPKHRAVGATVGNFAQQVTAWPPTDFGLSRDVQRRKVTTGASLRNAAKATYAQMAVSHSHAMVRTREQWPAYFEALHQSWYAPSLLVAGITDDGPRLIRLHRERGEEVEPTSFQTIGAWNEVSGRDKAFDQVDWTAVGTLADAGQLMRDFMASYLDAYNQGGAAEARRAKGLPLSVGYPIYVATITKDEIKVKEFACEPPAGGGGGAAAHP